MLSFQKLRDANRKRQKEWDTEGKLSGPLGSLYRANEMAGEAGEACNEVKKLIRERLGIGGSRTNIDSLADEIADVVICCDLLSDDFGIDLAVAVQRKFNATSVQRDLKTRLVL